MKSNELRIGNYIKSEDKILIIQEIIKKGITTENYGLNFDLIKPIQLTEEILFKCGFKRIENNWKVLDFICFKISWERLAGLTLTFENESIYLPHIKFLHQLQNLYWCLCEKELEINL